MKIEDIAETGKIGVEVIKQTGEIAKEPISNLTNPVTKTVGQRLSDIVDLIFTPVEIAKIYKDHSIEKFKDRLAEKIASIPEEKKVAPPLNVVGPALEASKYYIADDELREMFASLIANSMNSDTSDKIHPAFVETIKQLSPLDAVNFAYFKHNEMAVMVDFLEGDATEAPMLSNVAVGLKFRRDMHTISSSFTNLLRLGLLEKTSVCPNDCDSELAALLSVTELQYAHIKKETLRQIPGLEDVTTTEFMELLDLVDIRYWQIQLTSYGENFISVCIENHEVAS